MFIKENSGRILKTFGFSCVISIFGFMLSMATINNATLMYIGSAVMFCCYLYLMYDPMWQFGGKEAVSPAKKGFPAKGLIIMILSALPAIILTLICVIISPTATTIGETTDYNFSYSIFQIIRLVFHGVYVGIVQYFLPYSQGYGEIANLAIQPIIFLISIIPGILAGALGYYMGLKEKSFSIILGISTSKKKQK